MYTKKIIAAVMAVLLTASAFVIAPSVSNAVTLPSAALYASSYCSLLDDAMIKGQVIALGGANIANQPDVQHIKGTLNTPSTYLPELQKLNYANSYKEYEGTVYNFYLDAYPISPAVSEYGSHIYGDITVSKKASGTTQWASDKSISQSAKFGTLTVSAGSTLNIVAEKGCSVKCYFDTLTNYGSINISGGGSVELYINKLVDMGSTGALNVKNSTDVTFFALGNGGYMHTDFILNGTVEASFLTKYSVDIKGSGKIAGNVYSNGDVRIDYTGTLDGLVYAPSDIVNVSCSGNLFTIQGKVICKRLIMNKSCLLSSTAVHDFKTMTKAYNDPDIVTPVPDPTDTPVVSDEEETLQVVEYNVATNTFRYGTMKTRSHIPDMDFFVKYTVLNENTFVPNSNNVPKYLQDYCKLICESNEDVLQDKLRIGDDVTPFGRIDSEAWNHGLTISPYSTPKLELKGFHYSKKQMWLAMADSDGTVTKVWLALYITPNN